MQGAINAIGNLVRAEDKYIIRDAVIISENSPFDVDKTRPGYVIPKIMRGGEVKQFIRGGTAITLVGGSRSALPDSVIQDLLTDEIIQITKKPGYEETTIFSPDEKLGLIMSTRGSPKTNCAILGLLPRPYSMLVVMPMINVVYLYCVAGVRQFREGNIGPALVEIDKSIAGGDYDGVILNDPENKYVYCSPMTWQPSGKKVMWPEVLRGTSERRLRIAELLDYQPQNDTPPQATPLNIPYATTDIEKLLGTTKMPNSDLKIAGEKEGEMQFSKAGSASTSTFNNYSDDGKVFFNGFEKSQYNDKGEVVYEADLEMTGAQTGSMKCMLTFSAMSYTEPSRLIKEESHGFAEFDGVRINVSDMAE